MDSRVGCRQRQLTGHELARRVAITFISDGIENTH
jgi:hypothetical protein